MSKEAAAARLDGNIVKLFDSHGLQFKTLNGTGAESVNVSGDCISLTMKNGYIKIFDLTGRYIRTAQ